MTISNVVFDVGNVLIEWDRDRLYGELIPDPVRRKLFFEEVLTMHVNLALDAGAPFSATLHALAEVCPDWREEVLAFDVTRRWADTLGPADVDMVALAAELSSRGVGVFALTNFSAETWPIALERHEWLHDLDGAIVSGAEGIVKPNRAIYEVLLDRFSLDPATTWFTDDSEPNVVAAREIGLHAEVFTDATTARDQLQTLGVLG